MLLPHPLVHANVQKEIAPTRIEHSLAVLDVTDKGCPAQFTQQILFSRGEGCAIADGSVNSARQRRTESANRDNQEISYISALFI